MQTAEICGNENYLKLLKKKLLFTLEFFHLLNFRESYMP